MAENILISINKLAQEATQYGQKLDPLQSSEQWSYIEYTDPDNPDQTLKVTSSNGGVTSIDVTENNLIVISAVTGQGYLNYAIKVTDDKTILDNERIFIYDKFSPAIGCVTPAGQLTHINFEEAQEGYEQILTILAGKLHRAIQALPQSTS